MVLQIIYYGAPGTGKSFAVANLRGVKSSPSEQIFRTTFHPEYSYSDFIGQLLPTVNNKEITYEFHPGVFTKALKQAYKDTSKNVYLIIEEMSRGNTSAIFGDLFQLLDRTDKNVSRYPIRNDVIAKEIQQIDDETDLIVLPANLNIIATVNTNDQNVFSMDTAFKRRFDWQYIPTSPVLKETGEIFDEDNVEIELVVNDSENIITNWHTFYMTLNLYITDRKHGLGLNEDKQIGQFFIQFNKNMSKNDVNNKFQNKLLQYLWEDIESSHFGTSKNLFIDSIANYSELYVRYGEKKQVFSENFISYFHYLRDSLRVDS